MHDPAFWDDHKSAEKVMKAFKGKEKQCEKLNALMTDFDDYSLMSHELADTTELLPMVEDLVKRTEKNKISLFLSGEFDSSDALVNIYAGAGGKDAQDFAEMMLRMILRYCEGQEWSVTILDRSDGEEVGLKSITLQISGYLAHGLLKSESGVHRLVRLSPFNSGNTRETSFAKIDVIPLIEEDLSVEIPEDDLRIDVFRSSGKGGQSVNTTDSAVRMTHLPTGIVVSCQNERSQLQNKQNCLKILTSKLVEMKREQHVENIKDLKGKHKEAAWGNQIRSYVLHPYQMVKDHRTNHESSQTQKVLDGEIMEFVEAYLRTEKKA